MVVYLLFEPVDTCRVVDGRSKGGEEKKKRVNNDDNIIGAHRKPFVHCRLRPKSFCGPAFLKKASDGLIIYPSFASPTHMNTRHLSMPGLLVRADVFEGLICQVCALEPTT